MSRVEALYAVGLFICWTVVIAAFTLAVSTRCASDVWTVNGQAQTITICNHLSVAAVSAAFCAWFIGVFALGLVLRFNR